MKTLNSGAIDKFLWDHRENGCDGVKSHELDEKGLTFNIAWRDRVTGEEIKVEYDGF